PRAQPHRAVRSGPGAHRLAVGASHRQPVGWRSRPAGRRAEPSDRRLPVHVVLPSLARRGGWLVLGGVRIATVPTVPPVPSPREFTGFPGTIAGRLRVAIIATVP